VRSRNQRGQKDWSKEIWDDGGRSYRQATRRSIYRAESGYKDTPGRGRYFKKTVKGMEPKRGRSATALREKLISQNMTCLEGKEAQGTSPARKNRKRNRKNSIFYEAKNMKSRGEGKGRLKKKQKPKRRCRAAY